MIPQGGLAWCGPDAPADLLCGGIRAPFGYPSGILLATYRLNAGRFVPNTLRRREDLDPDPLAERLLHDLPNHAARDLDQPPAELPAEFQQQLRARGGV